MFKSILLVLGIIVALLFILNVLALFALYICFNSSGLDNNGSTNWKPKKENSETMRKVDD